MRVCTYLVFMCIYVRGCVYFTLCVCIVSIVFAFLYSVCLCNCMCVCIYVCLKEHLVQACLLCDPCPLTKIDNNNNNLIIIQPSTK